MQNKIAKIILPIALDREFDYSIPAHLPLKKGQRVLVDFNGRKEVGIVVKTVRTSQIRNLKPVIDSLDGKPSLNPEHICFARSLSALYPYTRNEFLFMMLPAYLKKNRKFEGFSFANAKTPKNAKVQNFFIKGDNFSQRYKSWKEEISKKLLFGSVLVCFPQVSYLEEARKEFERDFSTKIRIIHSEQSQAQLFSNWLNSRSNSLILGTRISIFYYPFDLELIVVEEENSPYYFQEEKPYYHLLQVAFMLSDFRKNDLILSADFPTPYTYKLISENKIAMREVFSEKKAIQVVGIQEQSHKLLSPLLEEIIRKNVSENKKIVLLWNRKGYAQVARCASCGYTLSCPYCSGFLHLDPTQNAGFCSYCGRTQSLAKFCPRCKSGYIRGFGMGIEKLEMLLKRIFPEVKIENLEKRKPETQVLLSTSGILRLLCTPETFSVGCLLDTDSFLSRLDYEATFNAFIYIRKLAKIFTSSLYVFTRNKDHYLFKNLEDWRKFYDTELSFRQALNLPPFGFIATIILRGKNEERLLKTSQNLYNRLKKQELELYGPIKEQPFKLRGKFRYSLVMKSKKSSLRRITKEEVSSLRASGIKLAAIVK